MVIKISQTEIESNKHSNYNIMVYRLHYTDEVKIKTSFRSYRSTVIVNEPIVIVRS